MRVATLPAARSAQHECHRLGQARWHVRGTLDFRWERYYERPGRYYERTAWLRMLIDSPIEVDSSCCGRLVGLLTRASSNRSCLPGVEYNQSHDSPLQWLQLLRPSALTVAWAVPDFHRLPIGTRRSDLYRRGSSRVKPVVLVPLYSFSRSDAPASFEEMGLTKNSRGGGMRQPRAGFEIRRTGGFRFRYT